jgi:hypothetical protein
VAAAGLLLLGWVTHEAWLADHLFYSPHDDYQYRFPPDTPRQQVALRDGRVQLSEPLAAGETLILEIELRSSGLGTGSTRRSCSATTGRISSAVCGSALSECLGQADVLGQGELRSSGRTAACRRPPRSTHCITRITRNAA